jgi:hypothetical protein
MININELTDTKFKRNGYSGIINNYLKDNKGIAFNYDELINVLELEDKLSMVKIINQLVKTNKIERGYKDNKPYVYVKE